MDAVAAPQAQHRATEKEEGHIAAQRCSQAQEGGLGQSQAEEFVAQFQCRSRIAAAAPQARTVGNALFELQVRGQCPTRLTLQQPPSPERLRTFVSS